MASQGMPQGMGRCAQDGLRSLKKGLGFQGVTLLLIPGQKGPGDQKATVRGKGIGKHAHKVSGNLTKESRTFSYRVMITAIQKRDG